MSIYKERPTGNCNIYVFELPDGQYVGYFHGDPANGNERWKNGDNYANNPELMQAFKDAGGFDKVPKHIVITQISDELGIDFFEPYFIKLLNSQYPNGYNKDSGGRRGYHRCQATKDKISAALGKPVDQIDPETGAVVASFPSRTAAFKATGISLTGISEAARGIQKKAGGYRWEEKF